MQEFGSTTVAELFDLFNVFEMTFRRDLRDLDREGVLQRVHGGAVSNLGRSFEPPYAIRSTHFGETKQAIGCQAAELIVDGDSLALDVDTTTLEIAQALQSKQNLTIITASRPITNQVVSNLSLTSEVWLILTIGINQPALHWDIIKDLRLEGRIYFDDKLVFEKGRYTFAGGG